MVAISGKNLCGTLNGVYSLLQEWGFRWIFLKQNEEIVPEKIPCPIPGGTRLFNPDLEIRGLCIFPVNQENIKVLHKIIDWMGKNRFNLLMTSVKRKIGRMAGKLRMGKCCGTTLS